MNEMVRQPRPRGPDSRHYDVASDRGAERAAVMYMIQIAKLNGINPQAWLVEALAWIAETPQSQLADLLPWNWAQEQARRKLAA